MSPEHVALSVAWLLAGMGGVGLVLWLVFRAFEFAGRGEREANAKPTVSTPAPNGHDAHG